MCPNARGTIYYRDSKNKVRLLEGMRVRVIFQSGRVLQVEVLKKWGMFCRGDILNVLRKTFCRIKVDLSGDGRYYLLLALRSGVIRIGVPIAPFC